MRYIHPLMKFQFRGAKPEEAGVIQGVAGGNISIFRSGSIGHPEETC
jgi:hypothetical protein